MIIAIITITIAMITHIATAPPIIVVMLLEEKAVLSLVSLAVVEYYSNMYIAHGALIFGTAILMHLYNTSTNFVLGQVRRWGGGGGGGGEGGRRRKKKI